VIRGLIHRTNEGRKFPLEIRGGHPNLEMRSLEMCSNLGRSTRFAVLALIERHRQRYQGAALLLSDPARQGYQTRRINAATQKNAEWNIADQVSPNRVFERRFQFLGVGIGIFRRRTIEIPILVQL